MSPASFVVIYCVFWLKCRTLSDVIFFARATGTTSSEVVIKRRGLSTILKMASIPSSTTVSQRSSTTLCNIRFFCSRVLSPACIISNRYWKYLSSSRAYPTPSVYFEYNSLIVSAIFIHFLTFQYN